MKSSTIKLQKELPFPSANGRLWYIVPAGFVEQDAAEDDYEVLRVEFDLHGYDLCVLNEVCSMLPGSVASYNIPELIGNGGQVFNDVKKRIEEALGQEIVWPTFIKIVEGDESAGSSAILYELDSEGREASFAEMLLQYLGSSQEATQTPSGFNAGTSYKKVDTIHELSRPSDDSEIRFRVTEPQQVPHNEPSEEEVINNILRTLRFIKNDELRQLGFDEASLRFLLGHKEKTLSRLRITRDFKIILEDYGNLEIKLDDKTKALYLLFLNHPEGICIKDLPSHIEEVLDLYKSISSRDDPDAMRETVTRLCNPFRNDANVSISRIKRAFVEAFSESIARTYYIDGQHGGARSIVLDRSLVIWDVR